MPADRGSEQLIQVATLGADQRPGSGHRHHAVGEVGVAADAGGPERFGSSVTGAPSDA